MAAGPPSGGGGSGPAIGPQGRGDQVPRIPGFGGSGIPGMSGGGGGGGYRNPRW